jgi:NADH-quinone oxidoreductase subunit A
VRIPRLSLTQESLFTRSDPNFRRFSAEIRPARHFAIRPPLADAPQKGALLVSLFATYGPMLLMLAVASIVASLFFIGASTLGTKKPTREKMLPFECGSESSGGRHLKLSVKFYLTAILFVVFDIEAVFIYPWAVQFRSLGWLGLGEMFGFLAVVVVALVYVWKKGALEWES